MNTELSTEEINIARKLLTKLQPGRLPLNIFMEVARLTVIPVVEVIPLNRKTDGTLQVLLAKRADNDPNWAGMLHVPGTIVLPTDSGDGFNDALNRIIAHKLEVQVGEPVFVENVLCKVDRGAEVALIYLVEVIGEPLTDAFYDVNNLPENIIEGQQGFIRSAVKKYETD